MKTLILAIVIGVLFQGTLSLAAPTTCFKSAQLGNMKVEIGWFQKQEYTVSKICIEGNYRKQGFNPIQVKLHTVMPRTGNPGAVVSYKASLERFSTGGARFTISDGEPEPTQWEATFDRNELVSVEFERGTQTQLVPAR